MIARSVALLAALGTSTLVREAGLAVLSIAVIAALVPLKALALFFAVCFSFVSLRSVFSGRVRRLIQAAGIVTVTLLLLYYKSSEMVFNDVVKRWIAALSPGSAAWFSTNLLAGLGVSYCFVRFVYALLDKTVTPWQFIRYYFFFPTFVSGPIMAPTAFLSQAPSAAQSNFVEGSARVIWGGIKFGLSCVLQLAVPLTHPTHFYLAVQTYSAGSLWLGLFLCGVWLYLNFSAFTDIAIGIGRMLGIQVPENFSDPFAASNITDFWRRWHITLGDWLRVNIFNSLTRSFGRSFAPQSLIMTVIPALATMMVCGLWHQTTWAYLAWGTMHGMGLITHQLWRRFALDRLGATIVGSRWYKTVSWVLTQGFVSLSWVFFFPLAEPGFQPHFGFHLLYLKRLFLLS